MKAVGIICDVSKILEREIPLPSKPPFEAAPVEKWEYEEKLEKRREKVKELINKIFFSPEVIKWSVKESIDNFIRRCKEYEVPYIVQVYDGVTDADWVKDRLWEAAKVKFKKTEKGGELVSHVFFLPDYEEDPDFTEKLTKEEKETLAILGLAGVLSGASLLIKKK
jgi:hypothetical protein